MASTEIPLSNCGALIAKSASITPRGPPIDELPDEIFEAIFLIISNLEKRRDWTQVTRVCRRWRNIALQCAALWTDFYFSRPQGLLKVMLCRSGSAPLTLWFHGATHRPSPTLEAILRQPSRWRSITITINYRFGEQRPRLKTILANTLVSALPFVEVLDITSATAYWDSSSVLPDTLLRANMPSLHHLRLIQCNIPWPQLPFTPTLTYLWLENRDALENQLPTMETLLASFQGMPLLQTLGLIGFLPKDSDTSPPRCPHELADLRYLHLRDTMGRMGSFLRAMRFPALATVAFLMETEEDGSATQQSAGYTIESLRRAVTTLDAHQTQSALFTAHEFLEIEPRADRYLSIKLWLDSSADPPLRPPDVEITFPRSSVPIEKYVDLIHRYVDLSSIRRVIFSCSHESTAGPWTRHLIHRLPAVHTITVFGAGKHSFFDFCEALAREDAPSPSSEDEARLPALTKIRLYEVFINDLRRGQLEADIVGRLVVAALVNALRGRPSVRELEIESCQLFEEDDHHALTQELPEIRISWDGVERL